MACRTSTPSPIAVPVSGPPSVDAKGDAVPIPGVSHPSS
jgi:hypothetical protein